MKILFKVVTALCAYAFIAGNANASNTIIFSETFDGVTSGYSGNDPRRFGIPDIVSFGADNNWQAARFEQADNGSPRHDVGVQQYGGGGNNTPVGLAEDDAGLLISFDASLYTDLTLEFDWRTFSADVGDEFVVGYYVGDLPGDHPVGLVNGEIDLRSTSQGGATDGVFNWEGGGWVELLRSGPNNSFNHELFSLASAAGSSQVWLAFWMDGSEGDFAKFDNITLSGTAAVVPVPAAVWLFGTALAGLFGWRCKR